MTEQLSTALSSSYKPEQCHHDKFRDEAIDGKLNRPEEHINSKLTGKDIQK